MGGGGGWSTSTPGQNGTWNSFPVAPGAGASMYGGGGAGMGMGFSAGGGFAGGGDSRPGDWTCPKCFDLQFARNLNCRKCNEPRPAGGGVMAPRCNQRPG